MHSLDVILKPLILNLAIGVVVALAALISVPIGILFGRRLFREKPIKTRVIGVTLLTGGLFAISAVATAYAGLLLLAFFVIEPQAKRDCAAHLQTLVRWGSEWAVGHGGRFPADFNFLSDRQDTRMIIVDNSGTSDRDAVQKSYELVTSGAAATDASAIFLRCPLHEHSVRVDGTLVEEKPQP